MCRGFSFRLLYRVLFVCFCLIFACSYHNGGSGYNRRKDKTEPNKLKEFNNKPLNDDVFLEQDECVPNVAENDKQIDGDDTTKKETNPPKMVRKETAMKSLRSDRIRKNSVLPSPSEVNVPRKESTTISHSRKTKWQNNGGKNISSFGNQIFDSQDLRETEKFASLTTQHLRSRRETDANSKTEYTQEDLLMCNDSIINIKYDDEYKVLKNFSILHKNKEYDYTEYRVLNDGIKICNSTDVFVRNIWKLRNEWVKVRRHYKSCKKPIRLFWYYKKYYAVNKQFIVYLGARSQYITRNDYGVKDGKLKICGEKLRPISTEYTQEDLLMCNDSIINIKYDDEYKVWKNFSILHKNKVYDYTEYRVLNDGIKICNSADNFVRNIWKLRNYWVKGRKHFKSCKKPNRFLWYNKQYYAVNKQFIVYLGGYSQYITRNDYEVTDGIPYICEDKLGPLSSEYTKEDLLMCNDSIINIKYDNEYKVWKNFSILHKNKVYDYTEYRVLNDGIKICNSTDNFVRNIWKLRNDYIKEWRYFKSCNTTNGNYIYYWFYPEAYAVNKQFTVYMGDSSEYFTRNDYGVKDGKLKICEEKYRPASKYTQKDLLMCNDSIINIKYDDEYKVWKNFSLLHKNKVYDYTEYRVLNDGIKICNSTDNDVRNIWKLRNYWVKSAMLDKTCNKPITYIKVDQWEYTLLKDFTVHMSATKQLITKYDYDIYKGKLFTCVTECISFTFTIKYEDEYRVWNNFSIIYQGRMYYYDEYRITDNGLQVCNSSDRLIKIKQKWRDFIAREKITIPFKHCDVSVDGFYQENYTLHTNFTVVFKPTNQYFTRQDYGVILGYFAICSAKLRLCCNEYLVKVKYGEQYNVFKNFSLFHNNMMNDYREYRFSHDGLEMCASNDSRVQAIWRTQNSWQKSLRASCSYKLKARYYTVTKDFFVYSADNGQYFKRNDYAVIDGEPYVCKENSRPIYVIANFNTIIAPLCALALSMICLLLLLTVYCMLPELRTIPGLNLMSLSFALLFWQIYLVVFLSLYSRVGKLSKIPCARLFVLNKFMTYSILMNAAVNIYHLRKTFCGNTLVKSDDVNKWQRFSKYSLFSWGVPVIITIVYIVLVKEDVIRFKPAPQLGSSFYRRGVLVNRNATSNQIKIYQRNALLKKGVQSDLWLSQSTVPVKEDVMKGDARVFQPIVSLKEDVQSRLKFYQRIVFTNGDGNEGDAMIYQQITGDCINGRITPDWSAAIDVYGLQGCLLLCILVMFIFTAYRIRQKLKASSNIAQKSNIVKKRKFVILLKLSTTTALSYWFPLFLSRVMDFNFDIKIALYAVTLLTGAYIGVAFAFTRRNYQMLKKKYFPAKNKPANEIAAV